MKKSPSILLYAGAVGMIGLALWYLQDPASPVTSSSTSTATTAKTGSESTNFPNSNGATPPEASREHPSQTEKVDPANYSSNPTRAHWHKDLVSYYTRVDLDDMTKAKHLLSRIPGLPHEGKVLAMELATKIIPDEQYPQMRPLIFQLGTSDDLKETILVDVLTRDDRIRMPALVELLRLPPYPGQEEIVEILEAYVEQEHGKDPNRWAPAVTQWLAANPVEE